MKENIDAFWKTYDHLSSNKKIKQLRKNGFFEQIWECFSKLGYGNIIRRIAGFITSFDLVKTTNIQVFIIIIFWCESVKLGVKMMKKEWDDYDDWDDGEIGDEEEFND